MKTNLNSPIYLASVNIDINGFEYISILGKVNYMRLTNLLKNTEQFKSGNHYLVKCWESECFGKKCLYVTRVADIKPDEVSMIKKKLLSMI